MRTTYCPKCNNKVRYYTDFGAQNSWLRICTDCETDLNYNFKLLHVPIKRKINLFYDLVSLLKIIILIKKIKPKISLSLNPKAGLLTSISAYINMVDIRVHIFNGQIWYNKIGLKKFLMLVISLGLKFTSLLETSFEPLK